MLTRAAATKEASPKKAAGPARENSTELIAQEHEPADAFAPRTFSWNMGNIAMSAPGDNGPNDRGENNTVEGRAWHFTRSLPWPVQAKLEVGAVDDPLEREADRVAEQVMRMPDPLAYTNSSADSSLAGPEGAAKASDGMVRRKCSCGGSCDKCRAEQAEDSHRKIQLKPAEPEISSRDSSGDPSMTAPPIVDEVLRAPGQEPDRETRAFLEPHFGKQVPGVRLHFDALAERSARALDARAYTVGNHIVFGPGQYAPGTHDGKRLLAHEFAHVVQQSSNRLSLQRQPADDATREAAEAELACTTSQVEQQADDEQRLKLDSKRNKETNYALTHVARDKARVEKRGLSADLARDIATKIRFFEGGARATYIRSMSSAVSNYPDEAQGILEPCAPTSEEPDTQPQLTCDVDKNQYLLQYEDEPEQTRCVNRSNAEFNDLFDQNIASAAAYSVPATTWENVSYDSFEMIAVKYKNGTGEYFLLNELGDFHYSEKVLGLREYTFFKRKKTRMIYPIISGRVYFNEYLTPRILAYKKGLRYEVKQLQDLYTLLQTAGAFAQIVALNAINEDFKNSIQGLNRSRFSGFKSVKRGGGSVGAGGGGVDTSSGVPEEVDNEPTERIGENERMGQKVGEITITGDRRMNGDTYEIDIGGLFGSQGRSSGKDSRKTTDVSNIKQVVSTLIAEGKANGAKQLKVTGYAIRDPNIMKNGVVKIPNLVRSLGGTVRATGPDSLEIIIPLK